MQMRTAWKGFLRFNLVTIPVRVCQSAVTGAGAIQMNQLHKGCNQRIKYKKVCPIHGEVSQAHIVSGYKVGEDEYVVVEQHEKNAAKPKNDKGISVAAFIKPDCIDAMHYCGNHFYLVPDGAIGAKPFVLLHRVM